MSRIVVRCLLLLACAWALAWFGYGVFTETIGANANFPSRVALTLLATLALPLSFAASLLALLTAYYYKPDVVQAGRALARFQDPRESRDLSWGGHSLSSTIRGTVRTFIRALIAAALAAHQWMQIHEATDTGAQAFAVAGVAILGALALAYGVSGAFRCADCRELAAIAAARKTAHNH